MQKARDSLYISDLDGTLLLPTGTLSNWGKEFLKLAISRDLLFTFASARSYQSIMTALRLTPKLPIIASNGAIIHEAASGKPMLVQDVPKDALFAFYQIAKKLQLNPMMTTYDGIRENFIYADIPHMGAAWYINERIARRDRKMHRVLDVEPYLEEHVLSLLVIDREAPLKILLAEMQKYSSTNLQVHFYENPHQPGWYYLFAHSKNASKGKAVEILARSLNVPMQNVVAFGDELNDMSMAENVGRFIATQDAHLLIKQKAKLILGSCRDDSVIKYLYQELAEWLIDTDPQNLKKSA